MMHGSMNDKLATALFTAWSSDSLQYCWTAFIESRVTCHNSSSFSLSSLLMNYHEVSYNITCRITQKSWSYTMVQMVNCWPLTWRFGFNALCVGFLMGKMALGQVLPCVDWVWNVMAHVPKPDFVFRRNRRVHLNQRGHQFSRLLAAEVCASEVVISASSWFYYKNPSTYSSRWKGGYILCLC